jgi:hypothetical protein
MDFQGFGGSRHIGISRQEQRRKRMEDVVVANFLKARNTIGLWEVQDFVVNLA